MTTIQSLLTRAIDRLLWWETLRDQVSTLGTHDPGAVSFAEAAFRHLSPSVVPRKNIGWMFLCVFADHSVRQDDDQRLWLLRFSVPYAVDGSYRFPETRLWFELPSLVDNSVMRYPQKSRCRAVGIRETKDGVLDPELKLPGSGFQSRRSSESAWRHLGALSGRRQPTK